MGGFLSVLLIRLFPYADSETSQERITLRISILFLINESQCVDKLLQSLQYQISRKTRVLYGPGGYGNDTIIRSYLPFEHFYSNGLSHHQSVTCSLVLRYA